MRCCDSYYEVRQSVESMYPSFSDEIRKELDRFLAENIKELSKKVLNENQGYVTAKLKSFAFIANNKYEGLFLFGRIFKVNLSNWVLEIKLSLVWVKMMRKMCTRCENNLRISPAI